MKKTARKKPSQSQFTVEELEERNLFSAGIEGVIHAALEEPPATYMALEQNSQQQAADATQAEASDAQHERRELVIVDSRVEDYDSLIAGLDAENRTLQVVVLSDQHNGIEQISAILQDQTELDAIHIISHGSHGSIQLGNSVLDSTTLAQNNLDIALWANAFAETGDILIYGCDLAETETGQNLVNALSELTLADVAASDDLTGHASQGGDWDLEYNKGTIESKVAVAIATQNSWTETLALTVDSSSSGSTADQTSVTVSHTTTGTNRLMLVGVSMEPGGESVSSVTYNGVNLSYVGSQEDSGGKARVEIWQLLAPDEGTANLVVNLSGNGHSGVAVGVTTFTGVNQTTPVLAFSSDSGDSATATTTVTSATDDLVFGVVAVEKGSIASTPDLGQDQQWEVAVKNTYGNGTTKAGVASVTNWWTIDSGKWSAAAVSIQADTNQAETVALTAVQDTYIQLKSPTSSAGTSGSMVIDRESGDLQRALVQFDLSSLPAGATIQSATIKLDATNVGGLLTVEAYQLLESWSEGSASWNESSSGSNWSTAGGTFNATALDSMLTDTAGQHTFDITSLAQAWVNNTQQNYGVIIGSPDGGGDRTIDYDTGDTGGQAPVLEIIYALPNSAPEITSDGGTATANINFIENTTAVTTVTATDQDLDTPTFSITGGDDQLLFDLDENTGVLTFKTAPNFENPTDLNTDNIYVVEVTADDGKGGTDVQLISVTVTDVNDAPVLDNSGAMTLNSIFENHTDNTGTLVSAIIASTGNPITDDDAAAAEGIAVTLTDDSNGSWQFSTDGGANWSDFGLVSDSSAVVLTATAGDMIRFVPNDNFNGTATIQLRAWDASDLLSSGTTAVDTSTNGGQTSFSTTTEIAEIAVTAVDVKLFIASGGDVTSTGTAGADAWSSGDVISIGDPSFSVENDGAKDPTSGTSGGTFYDLTKGALNSANIASSDTVGDVSINALHYVSTDITVGGTTTFDLLKGDVLLTISADSETFDGAEAGTLTVGNEDVFIFRPASVNDYSSGSFFLLFNDVSGASVPITGIALSEEATSVGTAGGKYDIPAGSLLYVRADNTEHNNIYVLEPDNVGAVTDGARNLLINGDAISLGASGVTGNAIAGIDLVVSDVVINGHSLLEGNILVALAAYDGSVGDGAAATGSPGDIFALNVTTTGVSTAATANLFWDASDAGLDAGSEQINALSAVVDLDGTKKDPNVNIAGSTLTFTEGDSPVLIASGGTISDLDSVDLAGGILSIDIINNASSTDRLAIRHEGFGAGEVGIAGNLVQYAGVTIGSFNGGVGATALTINFNSIANEVAATAVLQNLTFEDISGAPSATIRTLGFTMTDGDGGTSNVETRNIDVMGVNDAPVANDDNFNIDEDQTLSVTAVSAPPSAFFNFDEGSGQTISDSSGNGADGTLGGADTVGADDPAWTSSDRTGGAALQFDGTNDYVQTTSTDLKTAMNFTLSVWFKTDIATGQQHILWQGIGTENGWGNPGGSAATSSEMHLTVGHWSAPDNISFFLGWDEADPESINLVSSNSFTDTSEWHHASVVVTDIGGGSLQADLYVDGVFEGSDTGSQIDRSYWDTDLRISGAGDGSRQIDGTIDEVGIWTEALAPAQITDLWKSGVMANDTDDDGSALSATLVTGPGSGTLAFNADGSFEYTPDVNFTGIDTFTYKVNDGTLDSNVATVTITVDPVNDAPVANANSNEVTFDGNDFILINDDVSLQMDEHVTMEAWINHSGNGTGSQIIVNKEGEYELGITAETGEIKWAIATGASWSWHNTGAFVTAEEWTHVAVTYDGIAGEAKTYINGALVDTFALAGTVDDVYPGFNDLYIGGRENAVTQRFQGQIDDVRIWSTTRSAADIVTNYNSTLAGSESGLEGYWLLSTPVGNQVADLSTNSNDGTLGGLEGIGSAPNFQNYTTEEDSVLVIAPSSGVLSNDFDIDGDSLTVTNLDDSGMLGNLVLNTTDGSFTYDPRGAFDSLTAGDEAYETFTYTANDGAQDSNTVTVTLTVVGTNDAPVLSGANNLSTIDEDDVTNGGTLVSALISGQITDSDSGSVEGIAVTAVDDSNGSWEYTTDGGSNWTAFGAVNTSTARLLAVDANTSVRFVPDANWNGTVNNGITFHAWDQTSGTVGGTADLAGTQTVRDEFTSGNGFTGDDGSVSWSGDWQQIGETDGANAGTVTADGTPEALLIGGVDSVDITGNGVQRHVDLSAATSATLTLDAWRSTDSDNSEVSLLVSADGSNWTELEEFDMTSAPDSATGYSYDISAFASATTWIRFEGLGTTDTGETNYLYFDNVQIAYQTAVNTGGNTAFSLSSASSRVTVTAVNDAPTLTTNNPVQTFTENGGVVTLFNSTSISTVESGDLIETLIVNFVSLADGSDELMVVDGQSVAITDGNSATTLANGYDVDVSVSGTDAVVTITKTGGFTTAAAESLVDGLGYNNTSENPQGAARLVTLFSIKDDGGTANGGMDTKSIGIASLVNIDAVNDAPVANADSTYLVFDGGDIIRIADDPSLQMTNKLAMETWFNLDNSATGSQIILNKEGEYEIGVNANTGEIQFAITRSDNTWGWHGTGYTVNAGEWNHVAVSYDGVAGEARTYVNGELVDVYTQSGFIGDVYTDSDALTIGGRENDTDERFQGFIDDVRVWNTTRSGSEILNNFSDQLTGSESGLVH